MYRTDFDAERRILTITVEGFWTLATVLTFSTKMIALGTGLKLKHGDYAVLNDARKFPVQANEVARALDLLNAQSVKITKAPVATVVSTMLAKLQSERIMGSEINRTFLDWDEAVAWLDTMWTKHIAA